MLSRRRLTAALVAAIGGAVMLGGLAPLTHPAAADPAAPAALLGADPAGTAAPDVAWLRRAYGLTDTEARRRLAAEHESQRVAAALAETLAETLDGRTSGAWLEPDTGELLVGVTDSSWFAAIRAAGAQPRLMTRSAAELDAAKRRLDAHAARHGAGTGVSWYVDLPTNAVVVEVPATAERRDRAARAFLALARSLGDAVRLRQTRGTITPQDDLLGGQQMDTDDERVCSLGFHAADAAGRPVLLTAGHCGRRTSAFTRDGRVVGQVADARFPVDDFAVVWLDGEGGWAPQPWVDRYDTSPAAIRDYSTAPVGSTVCKSGATTRWTCGRIVAHDVTVSYDGGDVVYGLTQASTCSEGGDSGGPLLAGPYAQGMLSGGRSVEGRCLEQYGMENVSYFQPVAEPLSRYGLRLLTAP